MIAVSIVIPCFNAYSKIGRCLASLRLIDFPSDDYEVIFVDDKSTDSTYEMLRLECAKEKNWTVIQLKNNTGSPSKPRNEGVKLAIGKYVFFLDCDDEIFPDTIKKHYEYAEKKDACIVRGNLVVDDGKIKKIMNKIDNWGPHLSKKDRIELIISKQSTTVTQLIRKKLLCDNEILWPEDIRMGEDTIFLVNVLVRAKVIEYIPHETFIYNKKPAFVLSSTQKYGEKELSDHITVWTYAQKELEKIGVDYSKSRLYVGLSTVLKSLIYKNNNDISGETFLRFFRFISENKAVVSSYALNTRFAEVFKSILNNDYTLFKKLCRPRLLIAGHDLKFIKPAENYLSEYFDIRYDKWDSHTDHDDTKSKDLLEWAEIIWCEWMLGNSLWYSKNKRSNQKLVIRMHRQELGTSYAEKIDFNNVDIVFTVSTLFFERVLERFPNISRSKVRVLPNYADIDAYRKDWHDERLFTLAMIGILPSKKNFHMALEILKTLKGKDRRYKLLVYGRKPEDLSWLARNKEEMAYFEKCTNYISENMLEDSVHFKGQCEIKEALANDRIGYVLSLSESVHELPGFESFHLAVMDGFASGGVSLIKKWAGCEYIYPENIIYANISDIVTTIQELSSKKDKFRSVSDSTISFLKSSYSLKKFIQYINSELKTL